MAAIDNTPAYSQSSSLAPEIAAPKPSPRMKDKAKVILFFGVTLCCLITLFWVLLGPRMGFALGFPLGIPMSLMLSVRYYTMLNPGRSRDENTDSELGDWEEVNVSVDTLPIYEPLQKLPPAYLP